MEIHWRFGQPQIGVEGTATDETAHISMQPVREPEGCFAYEQTDIPPGLTLREWRHSQAPPLPRLVRMHHHMRHWIRHRL